MSKSIRSFFAAAIALCAWQGHGAQAAETIKIGIIGQFSGPFAQQGVEFRQGIETFVNLHGTRVGDREIEVIYRDVGGANPALGKRLAEELIVKNKVSMLGGFYLSPVASAAAPVVTETKTPTLLFTASSGALTQQSPYFIRVGSANYIQYLPAAEWVAKKGLKKGYISVADYSPGYDLEAALKTKFTEMGGEIVGIDHIPLNTVDFAPFAQRIKNANPDAALIFMAGGSPAVSFLKALSNQGVLGGKTLVIGNMETDDPDLPNYDDSVIGFYSSAHYAIGLPFEENKKFKAGLAAKFGADAIPGAYTASAYDGMRLFYKMIEAQGGKDFNPDVAMSTVKGYAWESPRGPVKIEPDSREITLNMYIRRVEKVDGRLQNVVIDTIPAVKASWEQWSAMRGK